MVVGTALLSFHLEPETRLNTSLWFARVPAEANIADFLSKLCEHPVLVTGSEINQAVLECLRRFWNSSRCLWRGDVRREKADRIAPSEYE